MKEALILIDIQNDYFPGGKMELVGMEEIVKKSAKILQAFRTAEKPIFFIRHLSTRPEAAYFIPGTSGTEIHSSISPLPTEIIIEKNFPNSFFQTGLLSMLKEENVTDLVICGAMSHMCVDTTVRAAKELGFRCILIADACTTRASGSKMNRYPRTLFMQHSWQHLTECLQLLSPKRIIYRKIFFGK